MRAEASQRQTGIGAARDHDLNRLGRVLDERLQGLVTERIPDRVPVLEDDHEGRCVGELLDQKWDGDGDDREWPGGEHLAGANPGRSVKLVEREHELIPELDRVGVLPVEREPRERDPRPILSFPLAEKRRLAVPSRGADERQPPPSTFTQAIDQMLPRHETRSHARWLQLRLEDQRLHRTTSFLAERTARGSVRQAPRAESVSARSQLGSVTRPCVTAAEPLAGRRLGPARRGLHPARRARTGAARQEPASRTRLRRA